MVRDIYIPQLGVNDEFAKITEWHCVHLSEVKQGNPLCTVETTKAVFTVESEFDGYIALLRAPDEKCSIKDCIAKIATDLDEISHIKQFEQAQTSKEISTQASKKAIELAKVLNIDLTLIPSQGTLIREKDVQNYYDRVIKGKEKE